MRVWIVDPAGPDIGAWLDEPDDCTRFSVGMPAPATAVGAPGTDPLRVLGIGWTVDERTAYVTVSGVRRLAADAPLRPDWAKRFGAMLDYAATKGWMSEDGMAIQAHIEQG
ncbi:MAG: hypothetical protein ACYDD4_01540 [Acidimicrobiales bacterium]